MTYLHTSSVVSSAITAVPRCSNVSGYGPKMPTRHMLTLTDGRTRRVYVAQYGNSGSAYVIVGGDRLWLGIEGEHNLAADATPVWRGVPGDPITTTDDCFRDAVITDDDGTVENV